MKTSHWHGPVKVTATSGGGGLASLLSLLFFLLVGLAAIGLALVIPWQVVVPAAIGAVVLRIVGRERLGEARVDAAAERTEHEYQVREARRRREQERAPIALPPAPPRALPAPTSAPTTVDHPVVRPDHVEGVR